MFLSTRLPRSAHVNGEKCSVRRYAHSGFIGNFFDALRDVDEYKHILFPSIAAGSGLFALTFLVSLLLGVIMTLEWIFWGSDNIASFAKPILGYDVGDWIVYPFMEGIIAAFLALPIGVFLGCRQLMKARVNVPSAWTIPNLSPRGFIFGAFVLSTFISFFSVNGFSAIAEGEVRAIFSDRDGYFAFLTLFIVLMACQVLLAQDYLQRVLDAVEEEPKGEAMP